MKKLSLLAILAIGLASCSKEETYQPEINVVKYNIDCTDCHVTFDVNKGQRTVYVTGSATFTDRNTLPIINVVANGTGDIKLQITLDNIIKVYETKWLGNGTAHYIVKMR